MYLFVVIAFAAAAAWLFLARPLLSPARTAIDLGVLSYAVFAILSGAFWVCWPQATVQLVPGHNAAPLVVTVAQARGLIVVALGVICALEGNPRRTGGTTLLIAPAFYNLMMSGEALAAQFTQLFTSQRWLYVTLHLLWAVCLAMRVRDRPEGTTGFPRSLNPVTPILAVLAVGFGLTLLVIPYEFQTPAQSAVASAFEAHATHGFGSGLVAVGALATMLTRQPERRRVDTGFTALIAVCLSLGILALIRASALGPLESATRGLGFVCLLGAGAVFLTLKINVTGATEHVRG